MEQKIKKLTKPYEIISKKLYHKNFDPIIIDFLYYSSLNIGIILLSFIVLLSHIRDYHSKLGTSIALTITSSFLIWELISLIIIWRKKINFS